jgi:hypothetical protein
VPIDWLTSSDGRKGAADVSFVPALLGEPARCRVRESESSSSWARLDMVSK